MRLTGRRKLGAARQACQKGTSGRSLEMTAQHTSPTLWQTRGQSRPSETVGRPMKDQAEPEAATHEVGATLLALSCAMANLTEQDSRHDTAADVQEGTKGQEESGAASSASPPRRQSNMQEACKPAAQGGPARETSAFIYPGKIQEDESSRSTLAP
eukprot:CAMPEP_0181460372 /NCGR_PEP_ID=MMETSP1110-20121109/33306_1 /TAXON_ID=174948 /ORGANISM="Symbiodinium sp., Strain CCMP421" /LENGTH=155 /DNA_ID=CAMNT_0023584919 /DNA_START=77 /DNA_END=546 /DNA_ORIENTATION=-